MTQETHIFYSPHADDETLSMGVALLQKVRAGHRVFVVLLTDGGADVSLNCLNGEFPCRWHGRTHDPGAEQYENIPLTREGYIRARQFEFRQATEILGVPEANLRIFTYPDGELPKEAVREVALVFEQNEHIPGPKFHHTMTHVHDTHPDHIAAGQALEELHREGKISQPKWYVKRSMWDETPADAVRDLPAADEQERETLRRVAEEVYKHYDPQNGHYAVGYHSVPKSFDSMLANYTNKWH